MNRFRLETDVNIPLIAKGFLKLPNLHMLIKQISLSLPRNLAPRNLAKLLINSALNKVPPLFNDPEVLSSPSDKAKLLVKNFSRNFHLDDSGIPLAVFPSRTNLKLHNVSITSKLVKKVITNLDLWKAPGLNCIPVVILKNCEPEFSYIVAELFNMCLKESVFQVLGRSHW